MTQETELYRLQKGGRSAASGIFVHAVLAVVFSITTVVWLTGEWTAWRLGFQQALEPQVWFRVPGEYRLLLRLGSAVALALFALSVFWSRSRRFCAVPGMVALLLSVLAIGPLYVPWAWFVWAYHYGDLPEVESIFYAGHWVIGIGANTLIFIAVGIATYRAKKLSGPTHTHGSADFASRSDVQATQLLGASGVILGGWRDGTVIRYLKHDGPEHCLVFAPSRSGKGASIVIPTLASWPHSCIVFDPKGENWSYTAGWRRRELKILTIQFNPVCVDGTSACFNPLLEIRKGPLEVRDAQQIADILTTGDGGSEDPHWRSTAADLLTGTILHVLYAARDKSLAGVLALLSDPKSSLESTLSDLIQTEHDPTGERAWIDPISGDSTRTHPVVASTARTMLNRAHNEQNSVLSTAIRCLALWRDFVVAQNTRFSHFTLSSLVSHPRPISLYLTIPVSDLARTRPLTRLIFALTMRRLTEELNARAKAGQRRRLLLLLDEFPQLHHVPEFEDALPLIAGFGIKALIVCQDLTQIYRYYGHNQAITNNCDVLVTFKTTNIDTARLISGMAGSRTVHKETRTYTGNRLNPFLPHVMASEQESQRPLLTPDEVMRLPEDDTLIFAGGQPIRGVKTPYYLDPEFTRRTSIPPPEESDRMSLENKPWTQIIPSARASAEPEGPADLASEVLPLDPDLDEDKCDGDESSGGPLAI